VRQARAVLDQATLTRDRTAATARKGIVSQADLDAAEANFRVAEGRYQDAIEEVRNRQGVLRQRRIELELAKQALSDSRLSAPFAGRVRERHATPGQYWSPARWSRSSRASAAAALSTPSGAAAVRRAEGPGEARDPTAYLGRVARVSPAIEEPAAPSASRPNQRHGRSSAHSRTRSGDQSREMTVLVSAAIASFAGRSACSW
jgi:multidrug efflux pump subunit AcrA (membrane-fusion protein)